jgi:uncharacterized protein YecT (DUF1311 family)
MNKVTLRLSTTAILLSLGLTGCGQPPSASNNSASAAPAAPANTPAPAATNTSAPITNAASAAPSAGGQADASDPCGNLATQSDMNGCEANRESKADAALTALYAQFNPKSPDLIASERAWIQYRDAECAFSGDYVQGGSMQPMVVSACQAQLTNDRIKVLTADLADLQPH